MEIWKPIKGYDGLYEVSNKGRIKSLNCYNYKTPRLLKVSKRPDGYLSVRLSKNNKQTTKTVHRLVADAFLPNINNYEMINHKDENRANNNVDNLEWCTRAYNQNYSINLHPERKQLFADNFKKSSSFIKKGVPHKYKQKVALINEQGKTLKVFDNASIAAKELNLDVGNLLAVCKKNANPNRNKIRRRKKCKTGGYIFVFIEE